MDPSEEAIKLLGVLQAVLYVCEQNRNNAEVMRELGLFMKNMKQAIDVLERRTLDRTERRMEDSPTPNSSSIAGTYLAAQKNPISRALSCQLMAMSEVAIARSALLCLASDELVQDLECAADSLQQVLKVPRNSWNIATLVERLRSVREVVIKSFETKLHITSFDAVADGDSQQKLESHQTTFSPAHRAWKAFPNSVRQNFSSIVELEHQDSLRHRVLPDELRRCLPRPGVDITPPQTSQRMEFDDDSSTVEITLDVSQVNDLIKISQVIRHPPRAIGNTETEAFFADVLANLEVIHSEAAAAAAQAEPAMDTHSEDEVSESLEDPITGDVMTDPIKCTDGRTYDRWTIIDNNLVKCPYDASMLNFHIAFDDIDVRARLFRAFPEKEQTYRTRRQIHRQKALEHVRKGENRDAMIKLNQVLQWNAHDEDCKAARDQVQLLLQPTSIPPLPAISLVAPSSSNPRSFRERIRRCSITSWLWRRRSR